jgi:hypothetical protein
MSLPHLIASPAPLSAFWKGEAMRKIIERIYEGQIYECIGTRIVSWKDGDHIVDIWKSRCVECGDVFTFEKVQEDHERWNKYMTRRCPAHAKSGKPVKGLIVDIERYVEG